MADVLVVDDSEFIRDLVGMICANHGWSWTGAASLAEAKAILATTAPRALLLDFHLPDGQGVELVAHVDRSRTAIMGLSMQPRGFARRRYAEEGIEMVLDKEVVLKAELANRLRACLGPPVH